MHHNVFQGPRSFVIHINIYAESLMDPMHSKTIRLVCVRPAGEAGSPGKRGKDRRVPAQRAAEAAARRCALPLPEYTAVRLNYCAVTSLMGSAGQILVRSSCSTKDKTDSSGLFALI